MSSDRASGLVVLTLGVVLLTIIIPRFVETVDGGVMQPGAMPSLLAWVLALGGGWMVLRPSRFETGSPPPDARLVRGASLYALVLGGGVVLMGEVGFPAVAPVLALVIMLMIGERRWGWLVTGTVAVPAAIWVFVALLLGRPLL